MNRYKVLNEKGVIGSMALQGDSRVFRVCETDKDVLSDVEECGPAGSPTGVCVCVCVFLCVCMKKTDNAEGKLTG